MKIHFIGIGGIGVSALAKYHLVKKNEVTGSDLISSEITDLLKKQGAKIFIGSHKAKNLSLKTDLVIYSPAVKADNPELAKAKKYNIETKSYPEALGELTKKYFTIAVSGTHGKSTTTALIATILNRAGFDPTVIVGTKIKEFGSSNCKVGKSKYLVIEADEWSASFLNYWPKIIVLTNIEREHLDYYKNLNHILRTFRKYINHLPEDGVLLANKDDANIRKLLKSEEKFKIRKYSLKQKEAEKIRKILRIPGTHNVSNALAALKTAKILKISERAALAALSKYRGSWRRFETIKTKPYILISDYAHHPTEIKATLSGARQKFGKKKIWVIFQPHQYQRTYYLFLQFSQAFDEADEIILTKVYDVAGREENEISRKVNLEKLVSLIGKRGKKAQFIENFHKIPEFLKGKIKPGNIVIIMGAGDINTLVNSLK